ncbi:nuclear transport factor 2 family protein [Thalassospira sp. MA62]|nr:nuclear transport factor 2 family protein [Thalassospira sp. MA62]
MMTAIDDQKRKLMADYARYYENLSPQTVGDLRPYVTDDFTFTDPFTTVTGPDHVIAYLAKAFKETEKPRFVVTHRALDGDMGFLRWRFSAKLKVIGDWEFTGMSALTFNEDGSLLASHTDHWDSGQNFYARIPVLGWFIRRLALRVGAL